MKKKLRIGIYIREIFSEEGTGSFTFVNSFLKYGTQDRPRFEFCFIFNDQSSIDILRKSKDAKNVSTLKLSDYNPNEKQDIISISLTEKLRFRLGSWVHKLAKFFFLNLEIKHPFLISDFQQFEKQRMEDLIDANDINLVLYPFWFDYPTIDRPFVMFYWDSAHRYLNFMPDLGSRNVEHVLIPALQNAFKVVVPNNAAIEEVESLYRIGPRSEKFSILPFSFPNYQSNDEKDSDGVCLKTLGITRSFLFIPAGFWPHKNHIVLVEALKLLTERGFDLEIVATGPNRGNLEYIKKTVQTLNLENRFHYLGFVERKTLNYLYGNCVAMVFPSIVGPNNYPPIEAASLGCPVILSDLPGHREQMGNAALYFEKFSALELVNKVELLLTDPNLRNDLCEKGKNLALQASPEVYFENLIGIFEEFSNYRKMWGENYSLK